MSSQNPKLFVTRKAEADLSGKQYTFVTKGATAGDILSATASDVIIGVLQDKPRLGEFGTVATDGILKVKVSGTVTENAYVGSDANGLGVAVTTGYSFGIYLDAGVNGDVVRFHARPQKLS